MRDTGTLVALLLAAGCAGARGPVAASGRMADLARGNGVCSASAAPGVALETCAARGLPGSIGPDGAPTLVSKFTSTDWVTSRPGGWRLTLTGPDGERVLEGLLPQFSQTLGLCYRGDCPQEGLSILEIPGGWRPGTWAIRYTYVSHPSYSTEVRLTLAP